MGAGTVETLDVGDCEQVLLLRDPGSGARALIAIHDTRLGPAFGGIRRWRYGSCAEALADVAALARAMTWKCALAELPAGGGKAVVPDAPGLDRRRAYEFLGEQVERLGGRFFTGPDVGTTEEDLRAVAARTRFCADPAGCAAIADGTARGVFAAVVATAGHIGRDLRGLRVLVQGLGAVGARLCARLAQAGADLLVADVDAARTAAAAAEHGARAVPAAAALTTPCDLLAPCALGGGIDAAVAASLPALAVCGAANNVLADARAGAVLHARGIPVAPDLAANAGGLIHGATLQLTGRAAPAARIDAIGAAVAELLARSRREDVPPLELAIAEARRRLLSATP